VLFASVEFVVFGGELFLEGFLDGVTDEDVLVSDGDHEGDERGDFGVHLDHFASDENQDGVESESVETGQSHLWREHVVEEGLGDHVVDGALVGEF